jgi:hypothetical protein
MGMWQISLILGLDTPFSAFFWWFCSEMDFLAAFSPLRCRNSPQN